MVEGRRYQSGGTNNYTFNVQPVTNESFDLTPGTRVLGNIAHSGQTDRYRFTVATAGRWYFDTQVDVDFRWSLTGPGRDGDRRHVDALHRRSGRQPDLLPQSRRVHAERLPQRRRHGRLRLPPARSFAVDRDHHRHPGQQPAEPGLRNRRLHIHRNGRQAGLVRQHRVHHQRHLLAPAGPVRPAAVLQRHRHRLRPFPAAAGRHLHAAGRRPPLPDRIDQQLCVHHRSDLRRCRRARARHARQRKPGDAGAGGPLHVHAGAGHASSTSTPWSTWTSAGTSSARAARRSATRRCASSTVRTARRSSAPWPARTR